MSLYPSTPFVIGVSLRLVVLAGIRLATAQSDMEDTSAALATVDAGLAKDSSESWIDCPFAFKLVSCVALLVLGAPSLTFPQSVRTLWVFFVNDFVKSSYYFHESCPYDLCLFVYLFALGGVGYLYRCVRMHFSYWRPINRKRGQCLCVLVVCSVEQEEIEIKADIARLSASSWCVCLYSQSCHCSQKFY